MKLDGKMTTDMKGSDNQGAGLPPFGGAASLPKLPPLPKPKAIEPLQSSAQNVGAPNIVGAPPNEAAHVSLQGAASAAPTLGGPLGSAPLGPAEDLAAPAPSQAAPVGLNLASMEPAAMQLPAASFGSMSPVFSPDNAPAHEGSASGELVGVQTTAESSGEIEWDEGDLGEKTMMLDLPIDEDLDDEKTQINMSAMDYEPLFGKLVVESGKAPQREYILVRELTTLGRGTKNEIVIPDISMSRSHAAIDKYKEGFRLRDLESGNGTVVNGYRIRVAQLRNGDIIEIGSVRFRFEQSGGDPNELWRGEAKIEYHPNQRRVAAASQPVAAPVPMQGAALSAGPSYYPTAQAEQPQAYVPEPQPAMEAMLQRPGGVAAAPAPWGDPSVSPYQVGGQYQTGMGMQHPNQLRAMKRPAMWVMVVFVVSLVFFFGSGVILLASIVKRQSASTEQQQQVEMWASVEKSLQESAVAYSNKRFLDARNALQKVQNLDGDNELVPLYLKKIAQEEDVELLIQQVRQKLQNRSITLQELESAMNSYGDITPASPYYHDIRMSYLPDIQARYIRKLKEEIREKISVDALSEAAALIVKLGRMEGTGNDVASLAKLVEDKQSQMK